jgi:predicted RNA-binding Zn ribbon-like protein
MLQQRPAGMRHVRGTPRAQELFDDGTVVGCGFVQNLAHVTSYTRDVKPDATPTDDVPADELAFNFRSARLCLAFVATVGERWRGNYERLRQPGDLVRWYREADLLDETITVTETGLDAARMVREAVHRSAKALIGGLPPTDADEALINAAAAAPPLIPTLRHGTRQLRAPQTDAQAAALSTVTRDAIDLFASEYTDRIRECASPECALLFVDTSRPGRRRWCSSEACGSKDRSAAYRRRQHGQQA